MRLQPSTEIFIDFEGNKDNPPTLLGILERTGDSEGFHQFILEDAFAVLAPSARHPQLHSGTLIEILREVDLRHGDGCSIYAWSSHEQRVIDELLSGTSMAPRWEGRIIDVKLLARRWVRIAYPRHEFQRTDFRGRHTLDQYLKLFQYPVPSVQGPGRTGARLRSLRQALASGQPVECWPPSKKRYWTNLLGHNLHDCYGLKAIVDRMHADHIDFGQIESDLGGTP